MKRGIFKHSNEGGIDNMGFTYLELNLCIHDDKKKTNILNINIYINIKD